jgi:hypothetical protein
VDGVWQRLDGALPLGDAATRPGFDVFVSDVVATDTGFVASGYGAESDLTRPSPDAGPRLWHSPDGLIWTEVGTELTANGGALYSISAVGATTVAVGTTDHGHDLEQGDTLAWYSTDGGLTWAAAEVDRGATELTHSRMLDVVATADGFVAVGDHSALDQLGDVDVAVWISGDGRRWSAAPSPAINDPDRLDNAFAVEALPDGRIVVVVGTSTSDAIGTTTLVGPPDRLDVVAETQPFVLQSLAPGLVPGQVLAGISPPFDPRVDRADSEDVGASHPEGMPGALFVLDATDLPVPGPAAGPAEPDADVTPGEAAGSDDEVSPDDCVVGVDDIDRSPSVQELRQLMNRATRELRAAGFDVVEGSIGEFVEVCDTVLLDPADEVTLRVYGDVEAARQAVAESFPGEPIVVEASALSSEEVSTAVPRVIDALDDATEQGLVPDGVQIVSIGGDVFGPADVLVELATADVKVFSDAEWADLQPAADALAAELSAATGLDVSVDRATTVNDED